MSAPVPLDWGGKSALWVARSPGSWNGFEYPVRPDVEVGESGLKVEVLLGEGWEASKGGVRRRRGWTGEPDPAVTLLDCSAPGRVAGWVVEAGGRGVPSSVNMLAE